MKILKMTATFGVLDQAVLTPEDGVNLFVLPNESGKSTWAAFLLAMFYGLDSRRAAKGRLAEKHRYQPWNGKPMSGTIELEHEGRILVLQRTSERSRPFGAFRAWDKETGMDVPELTADNCGRLLLGVEREVFRRSAFLCGEDLTVTQEESLARRLSRLAASGSGSDSYPQTEARLKLWQNRLRYHRTGLIPEKEEQLHQTDTLLREAETLVRQRLENTLELERLETEADGLEQTHRQAEAERKQALRLELELANRRAEALAAKTARLPQTGALHRMRSDLERLSPVTEPPEPPCPPALAGLDADEVWPKAQADAAEYERLTAAKLLAMPIQFLFYAGICAIAALVTLLLRNWWAAGTCGGLTVLCLIFWYIRRGQDKDVLADRRTAKALLASYGVKKKEDLLTAAMERRDWLQSHARAEQQAWEFALLLETIADFSPGVTAETAQTAIEQAIALRGQAEEAAAASELAQLRRQNEGQTPPDPRIEQLRRRCVQLRTEIEGLLRQETMLGGFEALEARRQTQRQELDDLLLRERAVIQAREALASANAQLTQIYAPRLTKLAGQYLQALTAGRYDGLLLEQDLTLSVHEAATELVRPLAALSRGTQDQTWLALRLAMTKLLLPEGAPLVLDDALLTFDRHREQAAMDVLRREHRQVLLFTCRE